MSEFDEIRPLEQVEAEIRGLVDGEWHKTMESFAGMLALRKQAWDVLDQRQDITPLRKHVRWDETAGKLHAQVEALTGAVSPRPVPLRLCMALDMHAKAEGAWHYTHLETLWDEWVGDHEQGNDSELAEKLDLMRAELEEAMEERGVLIDADSQLVLDEHGIELNLLELLDYVDLVQELHLVEAPESVEVSDEEKANIVELFRTFGHYWRARTCGSSGLWGGWDKGEDHPAHILH